MPHPGQSEGDDSEYTLDIDTELFDPDITNYRTTNNFLGQKKGELDGIFTGEVIKECFDGEPKPAQGEKNVLMLSKIEECVFGLVIDTDDKTVIAGHVLQCNPVQASISGRWDSESITNMQALAKKYRGRVWSGYDDPHTGNKSAWTPDDKYDTSQYR